MGMVLPDPAGWVVEQRRTLPSLGIARRRGGWSDSKWRGRARYGRGWISIHRDEAGHPVGVVFGGADLHTLYVASGDTVFRRRLRSHGVFPWIPGPVARTGAVAIFAAAASRHADRIL